jgi:hypothetical protein
MGLTFQKYMQKKHFSAGRDYISFTDFCELGFENGYPDLFYDVMYYLCAYQIQEQKYSNPKYYDYLTRIHHKEPALANYSTILERQALKWQCDDEEISRIHRKMEKSSQQRRIRIRHPAYDRILK